MNGYGFAVISRAMQGIDEDIQVEPLPPSPEEHVQFVSIVVPDRVRASTVMNVLSGSGWLQPESGGPFDLGLRTGPRLRHCGVKGDELCFEDMNLR